MPRLFYTTTFERKYKKFLKLHPDMKKRILEKLHLLEDDPYSITLRFHKLEGSLDDLYSISIDREIRIIIDPHFDNNAFYLIDIGTHDDVY